MNRKRIPTRMEEEEVPKSKNRKLNSVSFLDLPLDVIERILKIVFDKSCQENKFEMASVCKMFYETFCKFYRHKFSLTLDLKDMLFDKKGKLGLLLEHQQTFRVLAFSKLQLLFLEEKRLISYCDDFQELFKKFMQFLEIYGDSMTEVEMDSIKKTQLAKKILSFTRHIKRLSYNGTFTEQIDLRQFGSLTSLALSSYNSDFLSNVCVRENSLEELELCGSKSAASVKQFLSRQNSLKHLKCYVNTKASTQPGVDYFENLKLKSLELDGTFFNTALCLAKSLESQAELQSLKVDQTIDHNVFEMLGRMPKLRILNVFRWNSVIVTTELAVTDLDIGDSCLKTDEDLHHLKNIFPKLKKLNSNFNEGIGISSILNNFEELECLIVRNNDSNGSNNYVFNQLPAVQQKLRTLRIIFPIETNFEFLSFLPNLVELNITWNNQEGQDVSKAIQQITELPKLKRLRLLSHKIFKGPFCIKFKSHEFIIIEGWNLGNRWGRPHTDVIKLQVENGSAAYEIIKAKDYSPGGFKYSLIMATDKKLLEFKKQFMNISHHKTVVKGQICNGSAIFRS